MTATTVGGAFIRPDVVLTRAADDWIAEFGLFDDTGGLVAPIETGYGSTPKQALHRLASRVHDLTGVDLVIRWDLVPQIDSDPKPPAAIDKALKEPAPSRRDPRYPTSEELRQQLCAGNAAHPPRP